MSEYVFSAKNNAFYPVAMKSLYEDSGTWPEDSVEVSQEIVDEFVNSYPPVGKIRGVKDNLPVWQDVGKPDIKDRIASAESEKKRLLTDAYQNSSFLQSKLLLNRISDSEKHRLSAWLDYVDILNAIDLSKDVEIKWPEKPE